MYIELLWWDKSVTVLGFKKCTFVFKKIEIECWLETISEVSINYQKFTFRNRGQFNSSINSHVHISDCQQGVWVRDMVWESVRGERKEEMFVGEGVSFTQRMWTKSPLILSCVLNLRYLTGLVAPIKIGDTWVSIPLCIILVFCLCAAFHSCYTSAPICPSALKKSMSSLGNSRNMSQG